MNRQPRTAVFKQKVAIEALKEEQTISKLASNLVCCLLSLENLKHGFELKLRGIPLPCPTHLDLLLLSGALSLTSGLNFGDHYRVHPVALSEWKRVFMEQSPQIFAGHKKGKDKEEAIAKTELYEQIGRLKMEVEWLKKKLGAWG